MTIATGAALEDGAPGALSHEEAGAPGLRGPRAGMRILLFTDTLGDVNGVSRFIRNAAERARLTGRDLRVLTSTNFEIPSEPNLINFAPILAMKMPKYENLELTLPPLFAMLRYVRGNRPDVVHISTPGPVGLVGRLAARLCGVPMLGVYHTDFPAYIDRLFDDASATWLTERLMRAFYGRFKVIFTRSAEYVGSLVRLGMAREGILPLRPGIMTDQFHPRHRDTDAWVKLGSPAGRVRALYVGRVSVEKNLPLLTRVWRAADALLRAAGVDAELVVIGDGPYRAEMEADLRNSGARARFVGFRYGEELSRLYAGCDLFLFPSTTDTLGQVVMESQASGMPVIVTDDGGPKEVVEDGETGFVIPASDVGGWVQRVVELAGGPGVRRRMGKAAHEAMQDYSMAASFEHFWRVHEGVWVASRH